MYVSVDLIHIVPLIAHAVALFSDEHKATHWLSTPLPILHDKTPAKVFQTKDGIARVEQILIRIEHKIRGGANMGTGYPFAQRPLSSGPFRSNNQ
jgi:uncharacterized protein (DUF2384 family)